MGAWGEEGWDGSEGIKKEASRFGKHREGMTFKEVEEDKAAISVNDS